VIRTIWVGLVAVTSTYFFGTVALVASLMGVRGGIYTRCTQRWARAIMRASAIPLQLEGRENLRADSPQIVVCNHVSGYDIFALAAVVPAPFSFVGKKELDSIPFFGRAWRAAGHISIDRSNRHKAIATLSEAGRRIREERSTVIIFPEGTRSETGDLLPFKKGAFALAVESGAPIVPTVITGSNVIVRGGLIRPAPVTIRFGEPIHVSRSAGSGFDEVMRLTHERMSEMLYSSPRFVRLEPKS